jgi:hypothetical protein
MSRLVCMLWGAEDAEAVMPGAAKGTYNTLCRQGFHVGVAHLTSVREVKYSLEHT